MKAYSVLMLFVLVISGSALADSVSCDAQCDTGDKMVSFGDGDAIACACVPEGQGMDETVPNESAESPGESDI